MREVLERLPIHLKPSDQAGIQGTAIFDPIGTNAFVKSGLEAKDWESNIPIPLEYRFLGTNVDLGKKGVIAEVQFSNYPFLLNNAIRSELFFKAGINVASGKTGLVVIITKGHMFPASQSTLYFEQAKKQLGALTHHKVFQVPVRLVGLMAPVGRDIPAVWTNYSETRYSRTVQTRIETTCEISKGRSSASRCRFVVRQTP